MNLLKKKDFKILEHTFNIFQLPLRYTSEVFDYQASGKMLPYELKLEIVKQGCRLVNEHGASEAMKEEKIIEIFNEAPYQFHFLCKTIIDAAFEDGKKKAEEFLISLAESKAQPSENQTS